MENSTDDTVVPEVASKATDRTSADNAKREGVMPSRDAFEDALKIAAYPIAAASGYIVADTNIRRSSYKNFARHGLFDDFQELRKKKFEELLRDVPRGKNIDVADKVKHIEQAYREMVHGRFKQMNLHNLTDYWQTMHRNQKVDTLVMAATAAGISIGAMLTVAHERDWVRNLSMTKEQREEHEKKNQGREI